jgi:hypothetical protein
MPVMTDDPQDLAEQFDEDASGHNTVTAEDEPLDLPPDRPLGIPFADADVTDESLADRAAREEPEVWQRSLADDGGSTPADERLEQIVEVPSGEAE